jgi:hypothetical protein
MLKKTSSFVLTSLKASTYGKKYASAFRSLRPPTGKARVLARAGRAGEKTAFLNILSSFAYNVATSTVISDDSD